MTTEATKERSCEAVGEELVPSARILVVDDDERNLLALTQVLGDLGEVVTATSGRDALRHLLAGEFAVILLDVFMPGMDGYEVADLIRQRKQTARIPIIFLSAVNKETEHLIRGYAMGAVDYVFKPVDPLVLTSKVSVFVDLFEMRKQVEARSRAERELREAGFRSELERLRIENELHSARARQAAVLEALPLALFEAVSDGTGTLVREFVAGDLAKLAEREASAIEAGDLRWEDRIHPDDRGALQVDPSSEVFSAEYRWISDEGGHKHFIERAVRISEEGADDSRWAGTLFDVTDRKKLEAQLLQAGKMDALGQLTGGVAHDFNNVLAAVLGGASLLEKRARLEDRERQVLDQVRAAAERGVALVRRMMAFARKQDLSPVYLPPSEVCDAVIGLVQQTLGGNVELVWNCEETELLLFADRSQLELALVNLIINARDAMPGGGRIAVSIAVVPASSDMPSFPAASYLSIEVRDAGTGIPPAVLERITEPFFTTKEVGKGTGLGLSMVLGFVEQSGGRIEIDSIVGEGTSVRLLMPAVRKPEVAERLVEVSRSARPVSLRRILVVDDDPTVGTIIAEQLRELGATVQCASSAAEAFDLLRSPVEPFDLLLTDYAMPGANGLEVIAQARALHPDLPCVLMTGYADDSLGASSPDATHLLRKPVSVEDLEALLSGEVAA